MTYRVKFREQKMRVGFEVEVSAPSFEVAILKASDYLQERIGATAGQFTGWSVEETEMIPDEERLRLEGNAPDETTGSDLRFGGAA